MKCFIVNCSNIGRHKVPEDEALKSQWITATRINIQRKIGWNLRANSKLCSAHFKPSDFLGPSQRTLKKGAVPSIFSWTVQSLQAQCLTKVQKQMKELKVKTPDTPFDPSRASRNYSRTELPLTFAVEILNCNTRNSPSPTTDPLSSPPIIVSEDIFQTNELEINTDSMESDFCSKCDVSVQTEEIDLTQINSKNTHSVYTYQNNDKAIHFFTGLETFAKLVFVFHTLGDTTNLKYFYSITPKMNPFEQFFLTLTILRRHTEFEYIAMLYLISLKQVSNIFITWIRFIAIQWRKIDIWLDKDTVTAHMPLDFHDKYPHTRVILDCTECPIKKPSLPLAQQVTFSSYKNRNTVKFLIGISPSGMVTYVSPCYGGSATDRQIIERSSILSRFDYDDEIMVDKGLNVQDIFMPYGVKVNMPTFFRKGNQINAEILTKDRKVASKRVHVERVIGSLKTYKILVQPMNHTETLLSSDIVLIISMLINFRSRIVKNNA